MWPHRRRCGSTDNDALQVYGSTERCFVVTNEDGSCKGYGYVEFSVRGSAEAAKRRLENVMPPRLVSESYTAVTTEFPSMVCNFATPQSSSVLRMRLEWASQVMLPLHPAAPHSAVHFLENRPFC